MARLTSVFDGSNANNVASPTTIPARTCSFTIRKSTTSGTLTLLFRDASAGTVCQFLMPATPAQTWTFKDVNWGGAVELVWIKGTASDDIFYTFWT